MYKTILMMTFALFNTSVMAEWTHVDKADNANLTTYADINSIHKSDTGIVMRVLYDLKEINYGPHYEKYLSAFYLNEHDCEKKQWRILGARLYSGNMGDGRVVAKPAINYDWNPIKPNTSGEFTWKIACGK
jgi:hypothetical protein